MAIQVCNGPCDRVHGIEYCLGHDGLGTRVAHSLASRGIKTNNEFKALARRIHEDATTEDDREFPLKGVGAEGRDRIVDIAHHGRPRPGNSLARQAETLADRVGNNIPNPHASRVRALLNEAAKELRNADA